MSSRRTGPVYTHSTKESFIFESVLDRSKQKVYSTVESNILDVLEGLVWLFAVVTADITSLSKDAAFGIKLLHIFTRARTNAVLLALFMLGSPLL